MGIEMDTKKPVTPIDERFIEVCDIIIKAYGLKSERFLGKEIGANSTVVYRVRNGYQSVTKETIAKLAKIYPVDTNWISNGGGSDEDMFLSDTREGRLLYLKYMAPDAHPTLAKPSGFDPNNKSNKNKDSMISGEERDRNLINGNKQGDPIVSPEDIESVYEQDHLTLEDIEKILGRKIRSTKTIFSPFVPVSARATFTEAFNMGDDFDHNKETRIFHVDNPKSPEYKSSICFEVNGDSMEPSLYSGDIVLAVPIQQADWEYASGGVYAIIFRDFFVIKRIINNDLMRNKTLTLHSDNPQGGTLMIKYEDIRGVWRVKISQKTIK